MWRLRRVVYTDVLCPHTFAPDAASHRLKMIEVEVEFLVYGIQRHDMRLDIVPLVPDPLAHNVVVALFNECVVVLLAASRASLINVRLLCLVKKVVVEKLTAG